MSVGVRVRSEERVWECGSEGGSVGVRRECGSEGEE